MATEADPKADMAVLTSSSLLVLLASYRSQAHHEIFKIQQVLTMIRAAGLDIDFAKQIELTYVAEILAAFVVKVESNLDDIDALTIELRQRAAFNEAQKINERRRTSKQV